MIKWKLVFKRNHPPCKNTHPLFRLKTGKGWGVLTRNSSVFSLNLFQLTIPAGLRGLETLKSMKQINSMFQFNYWSLPRV